MQSPTRTTHDAIRSQLATAIQGSIGRLFSTSVDATATTVGPTLPTLLQIHDALVTPPNLELGDYAYGCFALSKTLRQAPAKIAALLASDMMSDVTSGLSTDLRVEAGIEMVQAAGPYLNIRISAAAFGGVLNQALTGDLFKKRAFIENAPRSMIEYSQPNTHKEIHVGHMRNICLGYAVVELLKYAGYEMITSTFPGDVGTHVAKCLWYMKFHNQEAPPAEGKGEWLGRMYSKGHLKLDDELGTPKEAQNREQLTLILKQLEAKSGEYFELWKETRQWSVDLMKKVYAWAGVEFDFWYWESDVDSASVQLARRYLEEGKLIRSEGAVGMDLSADGLGFIMLLKSDGTGLYATKDIELARRKFEDCQIEKSLYVVDMRQALHFKQVFKALEILGFEQAANCFHLQYNFVELPDGPMSSRKGNIIPLTDLIGRMEDMVKEQYLTRYLGEWSVEEISLVARQVAQGAIKYGMTKMDTNKKIVFDMSEWLKLEGESGPFIQYSSARILSLLKKQNYDPSHAVDWSLLTHKAERGLAQLIANFNMAMVEAAENYKPAAVCSYLYDLAKAFNGFYHDCPIGAAATADLKTARLALAAAVGKTLEKGLSLIGIPVPARM
jgi:arginyl-tRNA synthetase